MIIKVANNLYQMSRKQANKVLEVASEQVPSGVYAIEQIGKGYMELTNIPMTPKEIKQAVKEYGKQGMKLYYNR